MKLVLHKKLNEIKVKYEELFNASETKTAFQSFEFLKSMLGTFEFNSFIRSVLRKPKIYFAEVLTDENKTVLIMPISIKKDVVKPLRT